MKLGLSQAETTLPN